MDRKGPYKTINGKKDRVHRHLMEEVLGRPLTSEEHVYHINGNSEDNRLDNLVVIMKRKKYLRGETEC